MDTTAGICKAGKKPAPNIEAASPGAGTHCLEPKSGPANSYVLNSEDDPRKLSASPRDPDRPEKEN